MRLVLLLLLLTFNFSFAQNSVEKWNPYQKRYETFDNSGNMISYKVYNTYKNQWETYNVQSNSGYQIQQPQSSLPDVNLIRQNLSSLQDRYDNNLARVQTEVNQSVAFIYLTAKENGYTYAQASNAVEVYKTSYVNKISNGSYDFSYNSITNNVIEFLSNGCVKICVELLPKK